MFFLIDFGFYSTVSSGAVFLLKPTNNINVSETIYKQKSNIYSSLLFFKIPCSADPNFSSYCWNSHALVHKLDWK